MTAREIADRAAEALFGRTLDELTAAEREELLDRLEDLSRRWERARKRRETMRRLKENGRPPSLCQTCCEVDCPWVRDREPVPGWTAEATVIPTNTAGGRESYRVTDCPLFALIGGTREEFDRK